MITEALPQNRASSTTNEAEFHIKGYGMSNTVFSAEECRGIIINVHNEINATALKLLNFHHIEATGVNMKLRSTDF